VSVQGPPLVGPCRRIECGEAVDEVHHATAVPCLVFERQCAPDMGAPDRRRRGDKNGGDRQYGGRAAGERTRTLSTGQTRHSVPSVFARWPLDRVSGHRLRRVRGLRSALPGYRPAVADLNRRRDDPGLVTHEQRAILPNRRPGTDGLGVRHNRRYLQGRHAPSVVADASLQYGYASELRPSTRWTDRRPAL